jgi:hypothetical protein
VGEAGIVMVTGKIKSKLQMQGKEVIFVGYAVSSTGDTYWMYMPELNSISQIKRCAIAEVDLL